MYILLYDNQHYWSCGFKTKPGVTKCYENHRLYMWGATIIPTLVKFSFWKKQWILNLLIN